MGVNMLLLHMAVTMLYGLISLGLITGYLRGTRYRYSLAAITVGFACVLALRWGLTGHPPIFGIFEETLAAAFFVTLFTFLYDKEGRLAVYSVPFSFLTLLYGFMYDTDLKPLVISEQSLWVDFHALFAWIAYAFYAFGFVGALYVLIKRKTDYALIEWFFTRGTLYGFTAHSIFFFIGAYYSSRLNGNWWMWDPVEFLFLLSWFLYAVVIHGKIFFGWEQRKVAYWNVAGFASIMALYWGLVYMPWATYHIFETGIKMHF